jgi:hypothetical protein
MTDTPYTLQNELTVLLYTHSDFKDVLRIYIENYKKYFNHVPLSVCVNNANWIRSEYDGIFVFQNIYEYDETLTYPGRIASVLSKIDTPYTLLNQEINVIVDHPSRNILSTILAFMKETNADQVRLSDSGLLNIVRDNTMIHKMNGGFIMSVISAIWKTSSLHTLYSAFAHKTYRTIEDQDVQQFVEHNLANYYISSTLDIEHRPLHALSYHFPSIHVTHHGKWCIHSKLNNYYVHKLLDTYTIDISKRGIFRF